MESIGKGCVWGFLSALTAQYIHSLLFNQSLSFYLFLCVAVWLSVCLFLCLVVCLSVFLSGCLFFCRYASQYVCLTICLSVCLFVRWSGSMPTCLFVSLSFCLLECLFVFCLSICQSDKISNLEFLILYWQVLANVFLNFCRLI